MGEPDQHNRSWDAIQSESFDLRKEILKKHITLGSIKSKKIPGETQDSAFVPKDSATPTSLGEKFRTIRAGLKESKPRNVERIMLGNNAYLHLIHFTEPKGKILSDGVEIRPGDMIGELHLQFISKREKNEDSKDYQQRLKNEFTEDLRELAEMCKPENEKYFNNLKKVKAFYGLSYLANRNLAKEFGFDTEEIEDHLQRLDETRRAYNVIMITKHGQDSAAWDNELGAHKKFTPPRHAYISKARLVELYSKKRD